MQRRGRVHRGIGALAAGVLALAGAVVAVPVLTTGAGAAPGPGAHPDGPSIAAERFAETHSGVAGGPDIISAENPDVTAQAVIPVTTTTDGVAGSLREAVETFAVNGGGDTVVLAAGATYVLTCPGGDLDHGNTPLTIQGNGATITMAAGCNERILDNGTGLLILDGVQLNGVTISVAVDYQGGLVRTQGDLTLTGLTAASNSATSTGRISLFAVDDGGDETNIFDTVLSGNTVTSGSNNSYGMFYTWITNLTRLTMTGTTITGHRTCGVFCSTDVTLTDSLIQNTTINDTADLDQGDCGIVCSSDVVMTNSTIADSTFTSSGGTCGIFCSSNVTMTNSSVTRTTATAQGDLCGIFCSNDATMTDSSVDDTALTSAGVSDDSHCGIFCSGAVTMTRSRVTNSVMTVSGTEGSFCGGIFCSDAVEVTESSITGTRLTAREICGLLVCNFDDVMITNSTIADNIGVSTGGESTGAFDTSGEGAVTFAYVTFVGNHAAGLPAIDEVDSFASFGSVLDDSGPGGNCAAGLTVTSYGDNFVDDTTCGLTATGDRQGAGLNPLLLPLADNGGPGPTMLPATGSPLIDAVPAARCQTPPLATGITTDERNLPRPSVLGPNCEIGAVELQPVPIVITPTFTG